MHILSFYNFRSLNDYAGAARRIGEILDELPAAEPSRSTFEAMARWMEAFRCV